ncbi:hypothetical protein L2E82_38849 [Cichorium intybus]|uniref:Uncharacterized protein n=1 Tax=Cichorium intybus TaxID=13427 RepID=A0ACB9AHV8_CICIN|nr:hypothetical protein L2E82_38849 [Cichorium intybus]
MIGVARGLAHMHSLKKPLTHGGIRTFSILLDQNMNAKLAYFGLRIGPGMRELFNTQDASTSDMDTVRYLDEGKLSVKSDIFSFGIELNEAK